MLKTKGILQKILAVVFAIVILVPTSKSIFATSCEEEIECDLIGEKTIQTEYGTMTEGEIVPCWLAYGPITRYPAEGGTWEYGFWDARVRSYYTVNRLHGSTVILNGESNRSIDTAAGKKSIAHIWTIQHNGDDQYFYRICD